jgi:hypothetical protein
VKKVVTAAMFAAVLSASATSVRQLRTASSIVTACGGPLREDSGLRSATAKL